MSSKSVIFFNDKNNKSALYTPRYYTT